MIDPVLDRRLESCRQLMKAWNSFHKFLTACIQGRDFDDKAEATFLRLKSHIAILHDSFLDAVDHNDRDTAAISQTVITIVERCILLKQVVKMNVAELKKMEMEWHEAYLLINDTIGILEEEITRMAEISHFRYNMDVMSKKIHDKVKAVITSNAFKGTVVAGGLLAILVVAPMMGIFSYDKLDEIAPSPYRSARNLIRSTFSKDMPYMDMEDYWVHGKGTLVFGTEANEGFVESRWVETKPGDNLKLFIKRGYPGTDQLDLSEEIKGNTAIRSQKYVRNLTQGDQRVKDSKTVYAVFVSFPSNAQAYEIENKISAWKNKLPDTPQVSKPESKIMMGRRSNVLYFLFTQDDNNENILFADKILSTGLKRKIDLNAFQ